MPTYELSLVMKHGLQRPQLIGAVKRAAMSILESGGIIRHLEFVGERTLPARSKVHDIYHTKGHFFILKVDLTSKTAIDILEQYTRDTDIIRRDLVGIEPPFTPVCTLDDEFKPPTERPSVQKMIEIGRAAPKYTKIFDPKTGLEFYPFHK